MGEMRKDEALRIAKNQVKDQLKAEGFNVYHFAAKEIALRAKR